ncbi:MAG: GNAT family N-acetyltransferase [Erysipelotrichaceae bacterium]|nr:GNAT family N-acetyltransferase [Erysipelotrichaceae bacterium]
MRKLLRNHRRVSQLKLDNWTIYVARIKDAALPKGYAHKEAEEQTATIYLNAYRRSEQEVSEELDSQIRLLKLQTLRISSDRCYLRRVQYGDYEELAELWQDEEISRSSGIAECKEKKDTVIRMEFAVQDVYQYVIVCKDTGEVMGIFGIHQFFERMPLCVEFSYAMRRKFQNQGYMKEIVMAAKNACLHDAKADQIIIRHFIDNPRSRAICEYCGFTYEGYLHRAYMHEKEGVKDLCCWSAILEEIE